MKGEEFQITREKHLDHMVKVVPFIVSFYGIQCYVIQRFAFTDLTSFSLIILGIMLALMIGGLITYDLKHEARFQDSKLHIHFFGFQKVILFDDIISTTVSDPGQSFSSLSIKTTKDSVTLFFVDDADKIKIWIDEKKVNVSKAA